MTKARFFKGRLSVKGSSIPWKSLFPMGTKFDCARCGLCCIPRVYLFPDDIETLEKNNLGDSVLTLDEPSLYPSRLYPSKSHILKKRPNGNCVHLTGESLCGIYKLRPLICRTYPLIVAPTFENTLLIDLEYSCPFINRGSTDTISEQAIKKVLGHLAGVYGPWVTRILRLRNATMVYIQSLFEPAFVGSVHRAFFMDRAIDLLLPPKALLEIANRADSWEQALSAITYETIVHKEKGSFGGRKQAENILKQFYSSWGRDTAGLRAAGGRRWRNLLRDFKGRLLVVDEGRLRYFSISPRWSGIKIGDNSYSYSDFEGIGYSKEAVEMVSQYLKMNVRRASFQKLIADTAKYSLDQKSRFVVDYQLSSIVISKAFVPHIEALARSISLFNGRDTITPGDIALSISNTDAVINRGCLDGSMFEQLKKAIDS
jgi:Fe-S-cluster containining protein